MSAFTFPLQLLCPTRPSGDPAEREPARYAYALIDFGDDSRARRAHGFRDYFRSDEISDQVTWQLICRTNSEGFLVPVRIPQVEQIESAPLMQQDTAAHRRIDATPAYPFLPGLEFNLYWTYHLEQVLVALDPDRSTLVEEHLLHRCSTMFPMDLPLHEGNEITNPALNQTYQITAYLNSWSARNGELHQEYGGRAGWISYMHEHFFQIDSPGESNCYPRHVTRFRRIRGQGVFYIKPEDTDLKRAYNAANAILHALHEPGLRNAPEHLNLLDGVLGLLDRRQDDVGSNSIIARHRNFASRGFPGGIPSYRGLRQQIASLFVDTGSYINEIGRRMMPLYRNALLQAASHYEERRAQRYIRLIMHAVGVYQGRPFLDLLQSSDGDVEEALRVVTGEREPDGALDTFFASYKDVKSWGVFDGLSFVESTTKFLDELIVLLATPSSAQRGQEVQDIERMFNRLHSWVRTIEVPEAASRRVRQFFQVNNERLQVTLRSRTFNVNSGLRTIGNAIQRVNHVLRIVNFLVAYRDLSRDPSFTNWLSSLSSTADLFETGDTVYLAVQQARYSLATSCGASEVATVTSGVTAQFAAAAGIITASIDAVNHGLEGNNVAVFGNLLQGTGCILQLLVAAGAVEGMAATTTGVIGITVIVAGTLIVYWSLDEDEKLLLRFETIEPTIRGLHGHVFYDDPYARNYRYLRRHARETYFRSFDRYLERRLTRVIVP